MMKQWQFLSVLEKVIDDPNFSTYLRQSILALATKGKLVPNSSSSSKYSTAQLTTNSSHFLHAFPNSWTWKTLNDVCIYNAGKNVNPNHLHPKSWLLELRDLEKETGHLISKVLVEHRNSKSTKTEFLKGDVLYGKLRPYLTKVHLAKENGYSTSEIIALRPKKNLITGEWLALCLRRPNFVEYVTKVGMGTKMPRLRTRDGKSAPIPLPPINEQKRIVAKVDELLALCDTLEFNQKKISSLSDKFLSSTLVKIADTGKEAEKIDETLISKLLESITTSSHLNKFRETLRNLAVSGKLHQRTMTSFHTKNADARYKTVKLHEVSVDIKYGFTASADKSIETPKFLRITDIQNGLVDWGNVPGCEISGSNLEKFALQSGDIVIARTGGTIGKSFLLPDIIDTAVFASYLIRVRPTDKVNPYFLALSLQTSAYWRQLYAGSRGTGQPNVNAKTLGNLVLCLPQLDEQAEIVSNVKLLMRLCDQLEASLKKEASIKADLLKSLVT